MGGESRNDTIPIVIAFSGDPVGNGVVSNLARPGLNVTGFSYMSTDRPPNGWSYKQGVFKERAYRHSLQSK